MKIAIAGTGYVGLVTAACLADKGHDVTCVDVNEEKIRLLNEGIVPIYEPGLDSLIQRNGVRLRFTTNDVEAYQRAEVIMIAVGTPPQPDGSVRLDDVWGALRRIARAAERDCLVVIKSTVPVGTGDEAARFLAENGRLEVKFDVVSNPEFLSQGTAVRDTLQAPRIVLGVDSDRAERVMKELYAPFALPYVVTDRRSAEMIKYAANVFLALKISYINEIANVCELVGADIQAVAEGIGMDPRIGRRFCAPASGMEAHACRKMQMPSIPWRLPTAIRSKRYGRRSTSMRNKNGNFLTKRVCTLGISATGRSPCLAPHSSRAPMMCASLLPWRTSSGSLPKEQSCASGTQPLSNMSSAVLAMRLFVARRSRKPFAARMFVSFSPNGRLCCNLTFTVTRR